MTDAQSISIHALLAESDVVDSLKLADTMLFLSTLSLRRATPTATGDDKDNIFLSTLSLRRATVTTLEGAGSARDFYPRSPCGERRQRHWLDNTRRTISIHALLAESDKLFQVLFWQSMQFLSTLSLRRATPPPRRFRQRNQYFYPRSPCGERLLQRSESAQGHNFYPRSPCGERLSAI